jgi:hypothetical protein
MKSTWIRRAIVSLARFGLIPLSKSSKYTSGSGSLVACCVTVVAAPLKIPFSGQFRFRFSPRVCATGARTHPSRPCIQSDDDRIVILSPA